MNEVDAAGLSSLLQQQQEAFAAELPVPWTLRRQRLQQLQRLLHDWQDALCAAVDRDFGGRSPTVTQLSELVVLHAALRHALHHGRRWMRPQRAGLSWPLWPARAHLQLRPLGVVGIIGTWNYPLLLLLGPLIGVLAAGNRALLKPSERAPELAAVLHEAVHACFTDGAVRVQCGDARLSEAFCRLPLDHLVFTGSTAIGRKVAVAAAPQLTPLTLELGGKSPLIVDASADIRRTAQRLAWAKLLNTGQTCVAPDYVLVPRSMLQPLVQEVEYAMRAQYPRFAGNADYTALIDADHAQHLLRLLDNAVRAGARQRALGPWSEAEPQCLPPVLLWDVRPDMAIMQEEIFGPVLPFVAYDHVEEAVAWVQSRPRPLVLYWFGGDRRRGLALGERLPAGALVINDCMVHLSQENLPFGGIGASGYGQYHGEFGMRRFSLLQPVLQQSRWSALPLLYPPYRGMARTLIRLLQRWG